MHGLLIAAVVFCVGGIRYHLVSYRSSQAFNRDLLRDAEFVASRVVSSDGWRLAREGLPAAKAAEL